MIRKNIILKIWLLLVILSTGLLARAQDVQNDFQIRTEIKLSFNPLKNIELNLTPMLRLDEKFQFDQYLFEGEVVYNPFKQFSFGAAYRFIGNQTKKNGMEYSGRYAIFAEAEKKIDRFKPSLKISYTNYSDEEYNNNFLRYKANLKYDIAKSKITPELGFEAFHDLSNSNFYKLRYSVGADYKLFKNNSIGITYKLDYYMQELRNKHIISIGYKIKF